MKDIFLKIYNQIISEQSEKFQKFGSYKGIDIWISIEHVKQRNEERYSRLVTISQIVLISKTFLKSLIKNNTLFSFVNNEKPFVVHCLLSNIWITGRLKKTFNQWRIEVASLLPQNPKISNQDYFKELNI